MSENVVFGIDTSDQPKQAQAGCTQASMEEHKLGQACTHRLGTHRACAHARTHTRKHAGAHAHRQAVLHARLLKSTHARTHARKSLYARTHACTHASTHIHARTHARTHEHKQAVKHERTAKTHTYAESECASM